MATLHDEFFMALESSESRWTTLYIEGRTWIHRELPGGCGLPPGSDVGATGGDVAQCQIPESDDTVRGKELRSVKWYAAADTTWQMWSSKQKRRVTYSDIEGPVDVVYNGSTFWSNGYGRSYTNGRRNDLSHYEVGTAELIETALLCESLHLSEIVPGTKLARRTLEARATFRPEKSQVVEHKGHNMAWANPDFVELSLDRERGILLKVSSFKDGSAYRIIDTTKCEFDLTLAPDAFEIEPTFGASWCED